MAEEDAMTVTGGEFMLFGVRVVVDSMRKSVSLNNLSQYEHRLDSSSPTNDVVPSVPDVAVGYASADEAVANRSSAAGGAGGANRERKRGVSWTEEEHKLFLLGLQKVGKGDWRGISRNFVKTRTPTQVASHAQKYYIRLNNLNRRGRRRSSLFDITTDSVAINQTNDQQIIKNNNNGGTQSQPSQQQSSTKSEISNVRFTVQPQQESNRFSSPSPPIYPLTTTYNHSMVVDNEMKMVRPVSTNSSSISSKSMADFDLDRKDASSSSLSLNLSLSLSSSDLEHSRHSGFPFNNGDNIITVV